MTNDELRDRISRLVHDENERLRSEGGIRHAPLRYDELSDRSRKNRESIAQAVIDGLGLTVQETGECGNDVSDADNEWIESIPVEYSIIVGKWEKQ